MAVQIPYRLCLPPNPTNKRFWNGGRIIFGPFGYSDGAQHDIDYVLNHARRETSPLVIAAVDRFEETGALEGTLAVIATEPS
jgi:hypothetical protein